ncbi:hypothetical protein M514_10834 [Trichuris suis]|uniref:protein-serine/threonine phosphatase n=1 Tax=Trichuris suis TaxID=68888 RepID=A0A085N1E3_9BILA|nr:hypothetical protein M514_10834 [Trichuris suis]
MGTYLDKPRVEKANESGNGAGVRYGVATMQGWRIEMEDAHVARTNLESPWSYWSFFAVFDGHAGSRVARYAAANLLDVFVSTGEMVKLKERLTGKSEQSSTLDQEEVELVREGLRSAFLKLDEAMRNLPELSGDNEKSGSTVVCALITPGHIFVANLGDSRALVCQGGRVSFATEDHKPYLPKERCRIVNAGGSVMIDRVNGSLAVSRALGDYEYKSVGGLNACEQLVSPEPDLFVIERTPEPNEEFLLLACDGVFDVTTNQELCDFILSRLRVSSDLALICNEILDSCLSKVCKYCQTSLGPEIVYLVRLLLQDSRDNMSVVLVALPGAPAVSSEAVEHEKNLENVLRERIESIVEKCENAELATYQYVVKTLMREEIPGLPPGSGLHALRGKVETILDAIRRRLQIGGANHTDNTESACYVDNEIAEAKNEVDQ